jgi:hypothetical protein
VTERQRDRKTERQRDRETERQKDRRTERQKDRKIERQRHRSTERWKKVFKSVKNSGYKRKYFENLNCNNVVENKLP